MLKTQRFASLFRHYAKHHGLDKETLVFYFTEELQNEDTPESVHMQVRSILCVCLISRFIVGYYILSLCLINLS